MKKKPTRKRRAGAKASVGYRIVRAWFDTVVNPLIRALQTEQVRLDKRDWTWRFQPPSLAPFWNEHKESFWRVLDEPDGKPVYDRTVMAGDKLLKTVSSLLARLKEIRLRLSLEHDMPYVEVQPQVQAQPRWQ